MCTLPFRASSRARRWTQELVGGPHGSSSSRVATPSAPASWHLFNSTRKECSALGEEYPELKDAPLGSKTFLTYKARDGLAPSAYLHLPPGRQSKGLCPWSCCRTAARPPRDDGGVELVGAVLREAAATPCSSPSSEAQPASVTLRKAGKQQWGGKMQTDLVDGVAHLAEGTVDAGARLHRRGRYGGYAALRGMGALPRTPTAAASSVENGIVARACSWCSSIGASR